MSDYESDGEDFNPQPEVDEDEVAASDDVKPVVDDDDDGKAPIPQRNNADEDEEEEEEEDEDGGEDNDDDEEDDEEDEDEEDEVVTRPKKRRKQARRNMFIEEEAEVDEDEDEEEEGDDDLLGDEVHPDDLLEANPADLDDRHHRELDIQRQARENVDAEEVARRMDERYRRRDMVSARRAAAGAIPAAQPTVNDPPIWVLKCRPTKEREVVMSIMKRIDEDLRYGKQCGVYAVFERSGTMPGYIYVEADTRQSMMDKCNGVIHMFMGTEPKPISVKERPDLLRKRKRAPLEVGKFVRMTRGFYKGDLGKVYEVSANGLDCTIQLVPRLDYGAAEDTNAAAAAKRKRPAFGRNTDRPPQKLFNEVEAKKRLMKHLGMSGSGSQKIYTYKGDEYIGGFLIKDFKVNNVTTENVNPRMEELQFFAAPTADGADGMDLLAVQAAQKASASGSNFVTGDNVEVYDGEQKGLRGVTVTTKGDIVTIRVSEGELKGRTIDTPVRTLRKLFREGDHVKVIGGSKYVDEVGMITKIRDDKITLLCDSTQVEITVFSKDLKRAADSATIGQDSPFDLYDVVQIDASTVGCVVRVDREVLKVLDQQGNVRTLLHTQVSTTVDRNNRAVATDRDGSEIRNDDTVKEHGGENRQGKVIFIHRGQLFIQNRELVDNAGVFVTRSTNVVTMAAKSGRAQAGGPDLSGLNPALQAPGGGNGAMAPPVTRSFGRDRMIGKTVTIRKGPYKGLLGIVKDTMNDEARIELHTKNKQISIKKDLLMVKDPITGSTQDMGGKFPNRSRGGFGGATPYNNGGRTPGPSWGGGARNGPSWGGATPAANSGSRTPGWGSGAGGRTPGWGGGGDGSRTSYGGATAYGGATSYGGGTAYGGNDGSGTSYGGFGSGSRTPAWGGSAQASSKSNLSAPTPAAYAAPTPAAYSAPTPGGYGYSAPTPGAPPLDAPTPGNYSAPTPGDYYTTPAAAPTPGAWGGDEDPRYD